jgi:hypothetical protein
MSATRPRVRLAFNKDRWVFAIQIEFVGPLNFVPNMLAEYGLERDARFGKKQSGGILEVSPSMSIADRAHALEIVCHNFRFH